MAKHFGGGTCNAASLIGTNCIFWGNSPEQIYGVVTVTYSDVQAGWSGRGNIDTDPCFIDPDAGDCHLRSQAGRWDADAATWIQDNVTSLCIDAGDPNSSIGWELYPNGGIVNMGAHGGTEQASKSYFGAPVCPKPIAGDINGDCRVDYKDFAMMAFHWLGAN
jgi:hypothetical protein